MACIFMMEMLIDFIMCHWPVKTVFSLRKVVGPFFIRRPAEYDDVDGTLHKGMDETDGVLHSLKRISSDFFEQLSDNMNRSQIGIGFVENCLDFEYRHRQDHAVRKQLDDLAANQHRSV